MIEIIIAISTWCGSDYFSATSGIYDSIHCKRLLLACIEKDLKPGDYENKNYLGKKLLQCLKK